MEEPLSAHPALLALDRLPSIVTDVWRRHGQLREAYREQQPWPAWCYAPTAVAFPLVGERPALAAKVTALAAWRMTKTILRFDPTLRAALAETQLDAALPVDVLRRLPGWCIYVELNGMTTFRGPAHGVWCFLEPGGATETSPFFLSMLLNTAHAPESMGDERAMLGLNVKLEGDSLLESVRSTYHSADDELHRHLAGIMQPILSLLLYVCSAGAELSQGGLPGWPAAPAPVRTRRGGERLFPADLPALWDVGLRLGAALRVAYEASRADQHGADAAGRPSPAPHVRRPHWHTYVLGSHRIDLSLRPREVRWMPPIPVGVEDMADAPAVLRAVR